jgi:hypothetical protein
MHSEGQSCEFERLFFVVLHTNFIKKLYSRRFEFLLNQIKMNKMLSHIRTRFWTILNNSSEKSKVTGIRWESNKPLTCSIFDTSIEPEKATLPARWEHGFGSSRPGL